MSSSSPRVRTEPLDSIFITTSPKSHGGGFRVDTAAAPPDCAMREEYAAPLACGSRRLPTCRHPREVATLYVQ